MLMAEIPYQHGDNEAYANEGYPHPVIGVENQVLRKLHGRRGQSSIVAVGIPFHAMVQADGGSDDSRKD